MSRFNPHVDAAHVYDAAQQWARRCLDDDISILADEPLWTKDHVEELITAFVNKPDLGKDHFLEKLKRQLEPASPPAAKLMSEMLWILLLFQARMSPAKKREAIASTWALSGEPVSLDNKYLSDDTLVGLGFPGAAYNAQRWRELGFLILLVRDFKNLTSDQRKTLISDPWKFAEWLSSLPNSGQRQLPHILLHLLFPDVFERIASSRDKRSILASFANMDATQTVNELEIDKAILDIRKRLEREHGSEFDFYQPGIKEKWKPVPDTPAEIEDKHSGQRVWIEKTIVAGRPDRLEGPHRLGAALWSPQRSKSGGDIYRNMTKVREGDLVLHLTDNMGFTGASIAEATVDTNFEGVVGTTWGQQPSYRIPLKGFVRIDPPLGRHELFEQEPTATHLREIAQQHKNIFFNSSLALRQGAYLTEAPPELIDALSKAYHDRTGKVLPYVGSIPAAAIQPTPSPVTQSGNISLDDFLRDLFLEKDEAERVLHIWRTKKNIILQGPPGVGKSFTAKRLAYALIGASEKELVSFVQFHQSYAYEDFVQGYRPTEHAFALRNGRFYNFCEQARANADKRHVFVIDEINRGNLSKIFGELMLLIEPDKRTEDWAVPLAYSTDQKPFFVPANVFLLGLMNTADRSLAVVDYALRRRFAFFDLEPQFTSPKFAEQLSRAGVSMPLISMIRERLTSLNQYIEQDTTNLGRGFRIGHSFFCVQPGVILDERWYRNVIELEILPLLAEYWFDKPERQQEWRGRLLGE